MSQASRRPRVVHAVVGGHIGGVARLLVDLASRPQESGAEHSIALMTHDQALRDLLNAAGLRVRDRGHVGADPLSYLWSTFGPAEVGWLERVLEEERADLIHIHTFKSQVLGVRAARRRGLPILRTEHAVGHFTDPTCMPFRRWALRNVDSLVAVSEYVGRVVAQVAPHVAGKIRVIRNGVDTCHFSPPPPVGGEQFTFSVACRLEPWKQVDFVIRALAGMSAARLIIAGDGRARDSLQALARKLRVDGRVIFLGHQRDVRPTHARAHASVNASRDEPLGLSVLESLAMQRPVVAFNGGGIAEIVRDERTGWLVSDRSVDALAHRMAQAAASVQRAADLGRNGRAFVERECSIDDMCRGYASAYAELMPKAASQ